MVIAQKERFENPKWETVETAFEDLNTDLSFKKYGHLSLFSPDRDKTLFSWMADWSGARVDISCEIELPGYQISARGLRDSQGYVLIDPDKDDTFLMYHQGSSDEYETPLCCRINKEITLQALRYFYENGTRDATLTWWTSEALDAWEAANAQSPRIYPFGEHRLDSH
jgi:hypothetical protein